MADVQRVEDLLLRANQKQCNSGTVQKQTVPQKQRSKKKNCASDSEDDDGTFVPVRGRIVSGRVWKSQKKRANSAIKSPGIRRSFAEKQKFREEMKRVKELSRAMEQEKLDKKLQKKQRREENLRRAEENKKKNEIVQVVKNSRKIKKMRKSQLRMIEKRDVTKVVN